MKPLKLLEPRQRSAQPAVMLQPRGLRVRSSWLAAVSPIIIYERAIRLGFV